VASGGCQQIGSVYTIAGLYIYIGGDREVDLSNMEIVYKLWIPLLRIYQPSQGLINVNRK
jgi:hypothetical protein